MKSTRTYLACVAGILLVFLSAQVVAQSADNDRHWWLRSESKVSDEPIRSGGTRYWLITAGGQLAPNPDVFEGLHLVHVARARASLVLFPRGSRRSVALNERVALYSNVRRAFIIYKKGRPFSLGFARWEPSREPPMAKPRGIYQWVFKSPPGARTRDHRTRNLVTLETLGLFNTATNKYLVYDSRARELRWR